jgi:hypothetical protein
MPGGRRKGQERRGFEFGRVAGGGAVAGGGGGHGDDCSYTLAVRTVTHFIVSLKEEAWSWDMHPKPC